MKIRIAFLLVLAHLALAQDHWVATWTTAQSLVRNPPLPALANAVAKAPAGPNARGFSNQTVRMMVRTSIPGKRLRVKLANAFAGTTVTLGAAHVALRKANSEIVEGSDRKLAFNGKPSTMIGPGAVILSDPIDLSVPAVGDLAVSLFFPGETGPPTSHATALHTTYIKDGDVTGDLSMAEGTTTQSYYYLAGIDVMAPSNAALIVAYGDSITDGARSTTETNHSWPALLAARLQAKKETAHIGVANMGIGGNRVLRDGSGASALARLDRDVFSQSGVRWLMMLEGINDIGRGATVPAEAVTADELIGAYKQIVERAHSQGILVIGCTITPYEGAGYHRPEGEAVRKAFNEWMRTSRTFDYVVDFEAATRDPQSPGKLKAEYDPGDHLHPNDAGYQAMADAIDLSIFTKK
jgi:lysophospholipase L1-like esterase